MLIRCRNANSKSATRSNSARMCFSLLPSIAQECPFTQLLAVSAARLSQARLRERRARLSLSSRF